MRNTYSGRSILLSLGVGETSATFALQQIQLTPNESDPDAGATIIIVKAVQKGMNQLGCPLQITGRLDDVTRACLVRVSGPDFGARSWLKIAKDLVVMRDAGIRLPRPQQPEPVPEAGFTLFSPLGGLALAAVAYLMFKK